MDFLLFSTVICYPPPPFPMLNIPTVRNVIAPFVLPPTIAQFTLECSLIEPL